jgi:hypothetical protein
MIIDMIVTDISTFEPFMKVEAQDFRTAKEVLIVEHSEIKSRIGTELFEKGPISCEDFFQRSEAHLVPRRYIAPLGGTDVVPDSDQETIEWVWLKEDTICLGGLQNHIFRQAFSVEKHKIMKFPKD